MPVVCMLSNLNKAQRYYSLLWISRDPGLLMRLGFPEQVPRPLRRVLIN